MQRVAGLRHVAGRFLRGVKSCSFAHFRYASQQAIRRPIQAVATPSVGPAKDKQTFTRSRALPWVLSSLFAGAIGLYSVQIYIAATTSCPNPAVRELSGQRDVAGRYEYTADNFDSEVGFSEMLMGINRIRKKVAKSARGHVLEVSCGTGRNIGYFDLGKDSSVESVTFVDLAPKMVAVCKKKWEVLMGNKKDQLKPGLMVRFLPGSALSQMPLAPSSSAIPKKYDTIIQTMGLCSTPAPVELLENMARYLDFSNPEARIILLEHGRSTQHWLNNILDGSAEKHAEIHGCWFNREIGALVEEAAAKTGLEIAWERRHHLGTTWVFELKPKAGAVEPQLLPPSRTPNEEQQRSKSWFGWFK